MVSLFRALVAVCLCAAPFAWSQTKITSVEGITEYRLDNGLRVLLFPDASESWRRHSCLQRRDSARRDSTRVSSLQAEAG